MIEKTTVYAVICDNCGAGSISLTDCDAAIEIAMINGFIKHNSKYYCDDCYDDDNFIINKERTK